MDALASMLLGLSFGSGRMVRLHFYTRLLDQGIGLMDEKTHKELMQLQLEHIVEMKAKEMSDAILASPSSGLAGWIKEQDKPFADENSQADVEGRNRPARTYGGISGKGWYRGPAA